MAHGHRTLQHWNQWLAQDFLGKSLLQAEKEVFARLLHRHYGKHVVLIGASHQLPLLEATQIPCRSILSPLLQRGDSQCPYIESGLRELPLLTGSVDLVMLPHTLEFVDYPRQLLAEACRVVKPDGLIAICGFNPYSIWGVKKRLFKQKKNYDWVGQFIQAYEIKNWLQLAEFALEDQHATLFIPPVRHEFVHKHLHFLESIGNKCFPILGGVYVLLARATVVPLTPIRMKWKQPLGQVRISTSFTRHVVNHFENQ